MLRVREDEERVREGEAGGTGPDHQGLPLHYIHTLWLLTKAVIIEAKRYMYIAWK